MCYHPFLSSSHWQYHHPYSYLKSIDTAYCPHPNLYPNASVSNEIVYMLQEPRLSRFHNIQSIYYIPYQNLQNPYRQDTKRVEVLLEGIYCQSPGITEGFNLQIYGTLMVNDILMWNRDSKDYVTIRKGLLYPIQVKKEINVEPGQYLKLNGKLWEFDTVNDDDMGYNEINISYNDIGFDSRRYFLIFKEADQIAYAYYQVRII